MLPHRTLIHCSYLHRRRLHLHHRRTRGPSSTSIYSPAMTTTSALLGRGLLLLVHACCHVGQEQDDDADATNASTDAAGDGTLDCTRHTAGHQLAQPQPPPAATTTKPSELSSSSGRWKLWRARPPALLRPFFLATAISIRLPVPGS